MTLEFCLVFITTVLIASGIPGPSMLLGLSHGMRYGFKNTAYTATGNMVASSIQAIVSIAGLGILIATSGTLFLMIKYIGAAYLIYLGIMLWKSPPWDMHGAEKAKQANKVSHKKLFYQGFIVAAGNPKAIVFFTALFPQFLNPEIASFSLYVFMVVTVAISAFICLMIYAVGGQKIGHFFKNANISKLINKITGGAFVGGGVAIIVSSK